jgi:hypothetical protein
MNDSNAICSGGATPAPGMRAVAGWPLLVLGMASVTWAAEASAAYDLSWNVTASGGATFSTGGAYSLGATVGQEAAASASGGSYSLNGGFWQSNTAASLMLQSVKSRKTHGPAGTFELPLTVILPSPTPVPATPAAP